METLRTSMFTAVRSANRVITNRDGTYNPISLCNKYANLNLLKAVHAIKDCDIHHFGNIDNPAICVNTIVKASEINEESLLRYFIALQSIASPENPVHVNLFINDKSISDEKIQEIKEYLNDQETYPKHITASYALKSFGDSFTFGLARAIAMDCAARVIGHESIIRNNTTLLSLDFDIQDIDARLANFLRTNGGITNPAIILRKNYYDPSVSEIEQDACTMGTYAYQNTMLRRRFFQNKGFEMWSGLCAFSFRDALTATMTVDNQYANQVYTTKKGGLWLPPIYSTVTKKSETAAALGTLTRTTCVIDKHGVYKEKERMGILTVCPYTVTTSGDRFIECLRAGINLSHKAQAHSFKHATTQEVSRGECITWAMSQDYQDRVTHSFQDVSKPPKIELLKTVIERAIIEIQKGSHLELPSCEQAFAAMAENIWQGNFDRKGIESANGALGAPFKYDLFKDEIHKGVRHGWTPGFVY